MGLVVVGLGLLFFHRQVCVRRSKRLESRAKENEEERKPTLRKALVEFVRRIVGRWRRRSSESDPTSTLERLVSSNRRPLWIALGIMIVLNSYQRLTKDDEDERRRELGLAPKSDADVVVMSHLAETSRDIVVVTTASLPWMTGTSINPLIRCIALMRKGHRVTLVLPFLPPSEQDHIFHGKHEFAEEKDQEMYLRNWIREEIPGNHDSLRVLFYPGKFAVDFGSVIPLGDITDLLVSAGHCEFCILEEPEHLTWYHRGRRWTEVFTFVVGIMHTNYLAYAQRFGPMGPLRSVFLFFVNLLVCEIHCNRVIKLSDAVQYLPKSITCNVHGVRDRFLALGDDAGENPAQMTEGIYFLGKMLWEKGYRLLLELARSSYLESGSPLEITLYGNGPDLASIRETCLGDPALEKIQFYGDALDHASPVIRKKKVFLNPATSDVVCTATAEALAMGKIIIVRRHPSNAFFERFRNCILYETVSDLVAALDTSKSRSPFPLTSEERFALSWEAATSRLGEACVIAQHSQSRKRYESKFERQTRSPSDLSSCRASVALTMTFDGLPLSSKIGHGLASDASVLY